MTGDIKDFQNMPLIQKAGLWQVLERNQLIVSAILLSPDCKRIYAPRDSII